MKAQLNTNITFTSMHIVFNQHVDADDNKSHGITIQGHASHNYIWKSDEQEKFSFSLIADKELCQILEDYLEKRLATNIEHYPKKF